MAQLTKLNVGVLFVTTTQLLDLASVDLLAMTEKIYLRGLELPDPVVQLGLDSVNIEFISENVTVPVGVPSGPLINHTAFAAPEQTTLLSTSGKLNLQLTADITSPSVAPGKLDILVIPGPDPSTVPSPATAEFIRSHASTGTTDILIICTGSFIAAHSGILDGKTATGPRPLVESHLRKAFPKVNWTNDSRWVIDDSGRIWSSGGITNGHDMVAAYLRKKVHPQVAQIVCATAEVGDRPQKYDQA
ncbi:hypothetical protein DV738_g3230, partial [Chaetothyriales sp. CBS 135597]